MKWFRISMVNITQWNALPIFVVFDDLEGLDILFLLIIHSISSNYTEGDKTHKLAPVYIPIQCYLTQLHIIHLLAR